MNKNPYIGSFYNKSSNQSLSDHDKQIDLIEQSINEPLAIPTNPNSTE
jgi:hypothetical protein